MATGILYIMTTAVPDLIKIGITQEKQYPERMRYLEMNGYYNVVGLKRVFAIKVSDYQEKEHEEDFTISVRWIVKEEM